MCFLLSALYLEAFTKRTNYRMARFNPLLLQRPDAAEETVELTDPLQPGVTASFTLRARSDALWRNERARRSAEYSALYVTGDAEYVRTKRASGEPPAKLRAPDLSPVRVTDNLCYIIATLSLMQETALLHKHGATDSSGVPGDEAPMTFLEWAIMSEYMGNAFDALTMKAAEIIERAEGKMGNVSAPEGVDTEVVTPTIDEAEKATTTNSSSPEPLDTKSETIQSS